MPEVKGHQQTVLRTGSIGLCARAGVYVVYVSLQKAVSLRQVLLNPVTDVQQLDIAAADGMTLTVSETIVMTRYVA